MENLTHITLLNNSENSGAVTKLAEALMELGFRVELSGKEAGEESVAIELVDEEQSVKGQCVSMNMPLSTVVGNVLKRIPLTYDKLPLVVEGESKILRRWTSQLIIEKFKPTVYSFTNNRYGIAEGTDDVRARFSAEVFRRINNDFYSEEGAPPSAFVELLETPDGPLTVQREVEVSNLEIRVKRFHIGSPLHRYRYTENYSSTQSCGPIQRGSRFDEPLVCFDWRNPLLDQEGNRLADEPISDDYAAVWMQNVPLAKQRARATFLWLEQLFASSDFLLVDICFFIDKSGATLFGEISPDCMRVKDISADLEKAESFDKDVWRNGQSAQTLKQQYEAIFDKLFASEQVIS